MGIYLDHAATTPVDPEVLAAMRPYLEGTFGNPSSIHRYGQDARRGLDLARERVATLIGADPEEVIFTSGGTEADNLALFGTFSIPPFRTGHLVTSAIEHQAVLGPAKALEETGVSVTRLGVTEGGIVRPSDLAESLTEATRLVSVMLVNNDVGTIQPVADIAQATRPKGICLHTDGVQAVGKISIDVEALGVDMLSMSSHKIYGPKGAGALFVRRTARIAPILFGGHHESKKRAGTENLPAIAGFGKACEIAAERLTSDAAAISGRRDRLESGLLSAVPDAVRIGDADSRVPGTTNIAFPGVEGDGLLMALDIKGVAVSIGSACTSDTKAPSHVLEAMGVPAVLARGAIRFTLGRDNTDLEIDETVKIVADMVERLKTG